MNGIEFYFTDDAAADARLVRCDRHTYTKRPQIGQGIEGPRKPVEAVRIAQISATFKFLIQDPITIDDDVSNRA